MLIASLQRYADQVLFDCDDGTTVRYAAALEFGQRPALRFTNRQLVFCLAANVPGSLLGYLGLVAAGAVPLMLSSGIPAAHLARLLAAYQPAFVWLPLERAPELPGGRVVLSELGQELVAMDRAADYPLHDGLALLLSTSGSTGSPKMVRLSHQNISSNAQSIAKYLGITPHDVPITTLPPSYTYGLSIVHSHLLHGCRFAVTNCGYFDRAFWQFLQDSRASTMGGVPYQYEMLRKLRFAKMDLPSLRTLTQAGGRLAPDLAREFAAHCDSRGMRFFIMYGQAEASPRMSYLAPERTLEKPDSIGQAIPGGTFWLEDETGGRILQPDVPGQLVYQGDNVCMGYAERWQDLGKGDEFGRVLRTGDLARRDADGDYYIVGRIKRFLKLFGHRVNLQDVEDELQAAGHVAACTGSDDHLDIYLCSDSVEAARGIKEQLVNRLRVAPASLRVLGLAALPRNEAGKVLYGELPQLAVGVLA